MAAFDFLRPETLWKEIVGPEEKIILEFGKADSILKLEAFAVSLPIVTIPFAIISYWYRKLSVRYALTDKRIIVRKGLLSSNVISTQYDKITDIQLRQSFTDRALFNAGSLSINTAGGDEKELILTNIKNPNRIKNKIQTLSEKKPKASEKVTPSRATDYAYEIERLAGLKSKGFITEEEYQKKKMQILDID